MFFCFFPGFLKSDDLKKIARDQRGLGTFFKKKKMRWKWRMSWEESTGCSGGAPFVIIGSASRGYLHYKLKKGKLATTRESVNNKGSTCAVPPKYMRFGARGIRLLE